MEILSDIWIWLGKNWQELFAVVSGFIYLFFSIRQSIWLWPVGLFSSALFVFVFFSERLYADMGLYVYYVLVSIYGWHNWQFGSKSGKHDDLKIRTIRLQDGLFLALASFCLYALLAVTLLYLPAKLDIPAAEMPYLDAFTTSMSIVATWMLTKKYIEQWLIWIVINSTALGMYIYKGMELTAFLTSVYTIMSIVGYWRWKKDYKTQ